MPFMVNIPILGIKFSFCCTTQRATHPKCPGCDMYHKPIPKVICSAIQSSDVLVCPHCFRRHDSSNNLHTFARKYRKKMSWRAEKLRQYLEPEASSRLLNLPAEIRGMIYSYLFNEEQLDLTKSRFDAGSRPNRFVPHDSSAKLYSILLTCHQCFNEGYQLYYRYATVLNVTHGRFSAMLPQERENWPPGATTNMSMIMKWSRHVVEIPENLHVGSIYELARMESLEEVIVKLPGRRWLPSQNNTPQFRVATSTIPSNEQVTHCHQPVLSAHTTLSGWHWPLRGFIKPNDYQAVEPDLLESIKRMLQVKVIARVPLSYRLNGKVVWEICDYQLLDSQLLKRRIASEEEIAAEIFHF